MTGLARVFESGARWRMPFLAVFFLGAAILLFAPGLTGSIFNSDEAFLATQANVLDAGGQLYEDVTDRKPPVVPMLYTGVQRLTGTSDLWGIRVAAILARVLTAVILAAEAKRRWGGRSGVWAGLLFLASAAALPPHDAQAANFEIFMLPTMVGALALGARGRAGWSGAALAVSTLTKQTAAVGLIPLAYLAWRSSRGSGLARLAIGFVVPIAAVAVWLDPDRFLFWNYLGSGDYLGIGGAAGFVLGRGIARTALFVAANIVILALVWLARTRWREDLDLWLWLATGILAVSIGLRFFEHYYLQIIPIICLLAARSLDELELKRATAVIAVVLGTALAFQGSAFAHIAVKETDSLQTVSEFVQSRTDEDDSIFVWGHWPELYWQSDRLPSTRFLTTGFLTGHSGGRPPDRVGMEYATTGAWDLFEADLVATPPALVIVPLELKGAEFYTPADFPRFGTWLNEHYKLISRLDGVDIYAPIDT